MRRIILSLLVTSALGAVASAATTDPQSGVWVSYRSGKKASVKQAVLAAGGVITFEDDAVEAFAAKLPASKVSGVAGGADVAYVETDFVRGVQGDRFDWGLVDVQATQVWDANGDGAIDPGAPTGAGRIVCIVDTGLLRSHPDLAGLQVIGGTSLVPDGPWDDDHFGHGTFVAGIIAAQLNGFGAAGVAPGVSIYVVRAANDEGLLTTSLVVQGLEICVQRGANVVNMSLGGPYASRAEERAFANAAKKGVLVIAAAGNDGSFNFNYPAAYDSVVSVAALDASNVRAPFSQANDDVELAAPGVGVYAAFPRTVLDTITIDGTTLNAPEADGFADGTVTGPLEWGGRCDRPSTWPGAVVVCWSSPYDPYENDAHFRLMQDAGAVGLIVLPNEGALPRIHDADPPYPVILPLYPDDARDLVARRLGHTATLVRHRDPAPSYRLWDGTSFSTPHVAGVAALIWSRYPTKKVSDVRTALTATAKDLGPAGKDPFYGYGLVQAKAALQYLGSH